MATRKGAHMEDRKAMGDAVAWRLEACAHYQLKPRLASLLAGDTREEVFDDAEKLLGELTRWSQLPALKLDDFMDVPPPAPVKPPEW